MLKYCLLVYFDLVSGKYVTVTSYNCQTIDLMSAIIVTLVSMLIVQSGQNDPTLRNKFHC